MEKLKINIPESARDISLSQYQEFLRGYDKIKGDQTALNKLIISAFCELDSSIIDNLTGNQVYDIINRLDPIIQQESFELIREFDMGGISFGFVPDLENATFGEWADIDTYLKTSDDYHRLMAILYRPIIVKKNDKKLNGNKYRVAEYTTTKEYAEAMKLMPMDIALGALHFFSDLGIELLKAIPSYLENQMATRTFQRHLVDSHRNGDGIDVTINYLTETLQKYKQSVNSMY